RGHVACFVVPLAHSGGGLLRIFRSSNPRVHASRLRTVWRDPGIPFASRLAGLCAVGCVVPVVSGRFLSCVVEGYGILAFGVPQASGYVAAAWRSSGRHWPV